MIKFLAFLILLMSPPAWSKDLGQEYLKAKAKTNAEEVLALQKYKVIIIPGVLAESFISTSENQIKLNFLFDEAFREQIKLLEELKIEHEFIKLETENTPFINAKKIISAIYNSEKPILIYSHSKGGLDTLEALRQNPQMISKIKGWVSVQSPFWGASVASGFDRNIILRTSAYQLFEWMGGSAAGMNSLTESERIAYMNKADIKELILGLNQTIKFINYGSFKTNRLGIDTPLELFRNYTDLKNGTNDGVVPIKSALMKEHGFDIDFIIEPEVDHLTTMTRYRLNNMSYDQKLHTLALLKLLL